VLVRAVEGDVCGMTVFAWASMPEAHPCALDALLPPCDSFVKVRSASAVDSCFSAFATQGVRI
jgi:hypothetical protein